MARQNQDFAVEFDRTLRASHGDLRAYMAALGVPSECVDDLAQEVFLAWFRAPEQRPAEVEPVRWLKGIARRMALNFFRQSQRAETRRQAVMVDLLATEPFDLPVHADDQAEAALEHCLGGVSEKNRAVLRLRYEEDLPSHEIGRRLNMTAEAVRILLLRVRASLRDCITARMEEPA